MQRTEFSYSRLRGVSRQTERQRNTEDDVWHRAYCCWRHTAFRDLYHHTLKNSDWSQAPFGKFSHVTTWGVIVFKPFLYLITICFLKSLRHKFTGYQGEKQEQLDDQKVVSPLTIKWWIERQRTKLKTRDKFLQFSLAMQNSMHIQLQWNSGSWTGSSSAC